MRVNDYNVLLFQRNSTLSIGMKKNLCVAKYRRENDIMITSSKFEYLLFPVKHDW